MLAAEKELLQRLAPQGGGLLFLDEAGRGPFFGPVTVAAVFLDFRKLEECEKLDYLSQIGDSKKTKLKQRQILFQKIKRDCIAHPTHISVGFIERHGIQAAIEYAFARLYRRFTRTGYNIHALVGDGNYRFQFKAPYIHSPIPPLTSIIKGDETVKAISAASIIAKVSRDNLMQIAAARFPLYGLHSNMGYGTAKHREAIALHGPTFLHRKSFLKKML